MDKPKRHEITPLQHAAELRNHGEINFAKEVEELARNEHTQTLAQLTGAKKTHGLILLIVGKMQQQAAEIALLKKEVNFLQEFTNRKEFQ